MKSAIRNVASALPGFQSCARDERRGRSGTDLAQGAHANGWNQRTMGKKNHPMKVRLEAAIRQINAMSPAPDFAMYLGDAITDGTLEEFQYFEEIIATLKPPIPQALRRQRSTHIGVQHRC